MGYHLCLTPQEQKHHPLTTSMDSSWVLEVWIVLQAYSYMWVDFMGNPQFHTFKVIEILLKLYRMYHLKINLRAAEAAEILDDIKTEKEIQNFKEMTLQADNLTSSSSYGFFSDHDCCIIIKTVCEKTSPAMQKHAVNE